MNKIILTLENIQELVSKNKYKVDPKKKFLSRCIDGRYENSEDLPALAFPGADIGELVLIFATANSYGFEINKERVLNSFLKVVGGKENFRFHTDSHADPKIPAGGCGHWQQVNLEPKAYNLEQSQIDFITKNLNIGKSITLHGQHMEGAILIIKGNYSVYPQHNLETDQGKKMVEVFVYHQSLVDGRHREIAKELIKDGAVEFKNGEDEEWLYNAFSDVAENHLMETAKRLAKRLPIYFVVFNDDENFKVEHQGNV